jgi:hypothetical protein
LFSEGVTSDDVTVEMSNRLSEKESEAAMQTTRMGPLALDLNPQLEEDEHVHLSTTDDLLSSCDDITALATFPSPSSSSLHSMARSLDALPRSSLPPV